MTDSKRRAVLNADVTLTAGEKKIHADSSTDPNGRFKFTSLTFTDSTKVSITASNNLSDSDLVVTVNGDHDQRIPINYTRADEIVNIDTVLNAYLKNSKAQFNNTHTLKEVVIKGKKYVRPPSHKDDGRLATLSELKDYHLIRGDALWGWNSFLVGLRPLVLDIEFSSIRQNFYVKGELNSSDPLPVQIFVGGMEVDVSYLTTLDANTVESVELFLKDDLFVVNRRGVNRGIMVINLRRIEGTPISMSELKSMLPKRNGIIYKLKGYSAIRSFYSPRYDVPRSQQSTTTDTRSTIYWNPNINTDKTTGTATIEYFNADGVGTYRAIIEGIDKDGNIGRQVFRYEVK